MDYCTLSPEGFLGLDWSECCHAHDAAYTVQIDKNEADVELMKCIIDAGGFYTIPVAFIFFVAVSLFGSKFYNKARKPL